MAFLSSNDEFESSSRDIASRTALSNGYASSSLPKQHRPPAGAQKTRFWSTLGRNQDSFLGALHLGCSYVTRLMHGGNPGTGTFADLRRLGTGGREP